MFPVSNIGELIEAYQDKHGASDRALALRVNVTPTLIGRWKRGDFVQLPEKARIEALARQIDKDYGLVLEAFLRDVGYLHEESDGDDRNAAPTNAPKKLSDRRPRITGTDLTGLPSVAHKPPRRHD